MKVEHHWPIKADDEYEDGDLSMFDHERTDVSERWHGFIVIPAKRSASRNPARFCGNDWHSLESQLDSRPGLLSAGVTSFRRNDRSFWV